MAPLKWNLKSLFQVWDNFYQLKDLWKWWKCLFFHLFQLFSFSRYLNVCLYFLVMNKNGLIKKARLISTFMTSERGKPTTTIYILPNISKSKRSQIMKFGQLMEYNMRNIFLEKSCTKCGGETISRFFSKKSKSGLSLDQ